MEEQLNFSRPYEVFKLVQTGYSELEKINLRDDLKLHFLSNYFLQIRFLESEFKKYGSSKEEHEEIMNEWKRVGKEITSLESKVDICLLREHPRDWAIIKKALEDFGEA